MKQLAVIKNAVFGVNDRDKVGLSFSMYIDEHSAADWFLPIEKTAELFLAFSIKNCNSINGKTCWVEKRDGCLYYVGPAVI